MKVAVTGAGNMGAGLARLLAEASHEVAIGTQDLAKAAALAEEIGPRAQGGGVAAAFKLADVAIRAVAYEAVADMLREAGDVSGKILLDLTNLVTADYKDLLVGHTTSAAEEIQALAPNAKVVKAFNTIFTQLLPAEARKSQALQVFVAGDDAAAKGEVSRLVQAIGFEAVEAGPLANARFLEPVGTMNIHFGYFLGRGPSVAPSWVQA